MSKMLSFVKLDFITIKPYCTLKNLLILLVLGLFYGTNSGNAAVVIGIYMGYGCILVSYPFALGEKNGIDTLYATLGISRGEVVTGRYIFTVCLNTITFVFSVAMALFLPGLFGTEMNPMEVYLTAVSCFMIFSMIEAIQLALYFKLNYGKAKFFTYIPFMAFPVVVLAITSLTTAADRDNFIKNLVAFVENNAAITGTLCIGAGLLCLAMSLVISCRLYKSRDL